MNYCLPCLTRSVFKANTGRSEARGSVDGGDGGGGGGGGGEGGGGGGGGARLRQRRKSDNNAEFADTSAAAAEDNRLDPSVRSHYVTYDAAYQFFHSKLGHVEIVMDGVLQKAYFPIPVKVPEKPLVTLDASLPLFALLN